MSFCCGERNIRKGEPCKIIEYFSYFYYKLN